jgi:Xaa-Pro dipeptidase
VSATLLRLGSETPCQGPIIAAGWRSGAPHSSLGRQALRRGDAVFIEVTGEWRRYCAPLMRTAILGEPSLEQARAASIGKAALEAVIATARPGIAAAEVATAAGEIIAPALPDLRFHGNFGYPIGLGFPPTWTESLGFQLRHDNPHRLAAGMTFHLPVSLRRPGEWGVCQSQTILVTETGAEPLTQTNSDVRIVG